MISFKGTLSKGVTDMCSKGLNEKSIYHLISKEIHVHIEVENKDSIGMKLF